MLFMFRTIAVLILLVTLFPGTAAGAELAGVRVDDRVTVRDGTELPLHGIGLREKFFFDIYVGALYLPSTGQPVERILDTDQPGRIEMHFVYDEVTRDQLAAAWDEGFAANNPPGVLDEFDGRIDRFIGLFPDAVAGDRFAMEYVPGGGTEVRINGERAGMIEGGGFFQALLAVFLGPEPPSGDLRRGMLGR
jgi:hypothetical protein